MYCAPACLEFSSSAMRSGLWSECVYSINLVPKGSTPLPHFPHPLTERQRKVGEIMAQSKKQ